MIPAVATSGRCESAYACGPVRLEVEFEDPSLHEALHGLLSQYDASWPEDQIVIRVAVTSCQGPPAISPAGSYLTLTRLNVDRDGGRLLSLGKLGSAMEFDFKRMIASVTVPQHADWPALVEEVEQHFVLLLARAWAGCGWTPLHGGTLVLPDDLRCVCLCAPSGVGKTTLTAAMLRRGWRTLGDDKTLLRKEGNEIIARSLAQRFHLHPLTSQWFPEAGDLSVWPAYSRWTDKRMVQIESLWPGRFLVRALPKAVVQLERDHGSSRITVEPLDRIASLNVLLRQIAIPKNAEHARPLVACIASAASQMRGALVKIGQNAFSDPVASEQLETEFRKLLL